jgi:hypothetical protein
LAKIHFSHACKTVSSFSAIHVASQTIRAITFWDSASPQSFFQGSSCQFLKDGCFCKYAAISAAGSHPGGRSW